MQCGIIGEVVKFDIDHSFLTFKEELLEYGYEVTKISIMAILQEILKAQVKNDTNKQINDLKSEIANSGII